MDHQKQLQVLMGYLRRRFLVPIMETLANADGSLPQSAEDDKIEKEFVAEQLLKIANIMDLTDNAGEWCDSSTSITSL